jgi:hypothetical protein
MPLTARTGATAASRSPSASISPDACARRPATRISRGAGALTVSASAAFAAPSSSASQPSRWR